MPEVDSLREASAELKNAASDMTVRKLAALLADAGYVAENTVNHPFAMYDFQVWNHDKANAIIMRACKLENEPVELFVQCSPGDIVQYIMDKQL